MTATEAIEFVLSLAEEAVRHGDDLPHQEYAKQAISIVRDVVLNHYKANNDDQAQ